MNAGHPQHTVKTACTKTPLADWNRSKGHASLSVQKLASYLDDATKLRSLAAGSFGLLPSALRRRRSAETVVLSLCLGLSWDGHCRWSSSWLAMLYGASSMQRLHDSDQKRGHSKRRLHCMGGTAPIGSD